MYLKQGDLFWDMTKDFVKSAMDASEKIKQTSGQDLFREGDVADHFYILLTGRMKLSVGETGRVVYIARHAGEIIGWSSLIGRSDYSATAVCTEDSSLLKFESRHFLNLLSRDAGNEAILYRRLSEMLGHRLLEIYPSIT
jgi:CRP-like cAMP-binding protein